MQHRSIDSQKDSNARRDAARPFDPTRDKPRRCDGTDGAGRGPPRRHALPLSRPARASGGLRCPAERGRPARRARDDRARYRHRLCQRVSRLPAGARDRGAGFPARIDAAAASGPAQRHRRRCAARCRRGRRRTCRRMGERTLRQPADGRRHRIVGPAIAPGDDPFVRKGLGRIGQPRRRCLPAVHLRFDRDPEGGDGDARQYRRQPGGHRPPVRHHGRRRDGQLAAALSRHGPDRRTVASALWRHAAGADVADVFPAAAAPLAGGNRPIRRHRQRRSRLRLSAVRGARASGTGADAFAAQLACRLLRRRADPRRDTGTVRQPLRRCRPRRQRALSLLWTGGGNAACHRRASRRRCHEGRFRRSGAGRGTCRGIARW